MLCPRCYGKHVVTLNGSRIPCPECAGVGEIHCCDGLREQDCPTSAENPKYQAANSKMKADEPTSRA
jgi:hypothetical protein